MVVTDFADDGHAARAEDIVKDADSRNLRLGDRQTLIALDLCAKRNSGAEGGTRYVTTGVDGCDMVGQRRTSQIVGADLHRLVGPVAELAGQGGAADVGLEAYAVDTDVFRVGEEVVAKHGYVELAGLRVGCGADDGGISGVAGRGGVVGREATVNVHEVQAELGLIQLLCVVAERDAELAVVSGVAIGAARQVHEGWISDGTVLASPHADLVATVSQGIARREEGAAVVDDRLIPLQLVEGFDPEILGQALGQVEHVDRNKAFLDLCAGSTEGGRVDRVDAVDAILNEGTFTPAHHLPADADRARHVANGIVVV